MRDICDKIYPNTNMIALLYGVVEGSLSQDISDLFGFKVRQKKVGIVMRLEKGGDLDSALKRNISWYLKMRLGILKNIAEGLRELHNAD